MRQKDPLSIKKSVMIIVLTCLGFVTSYITFISIISIRLGFANVTQDGFIIPILTGFLLIFFFIGLFILSTIYFIKNMKEKDLINR